MTKSQARELIAAAKAASKVLGRVITETHRPDAVGAKFLLDLAVYEATTK